MKLDNIDIEIIKNLRKNARSSVASIARILGISSNTTQIRYKKIQKSGIIKQTFIPTFLPQYSKKKSLGNRFNHKKRGKSVLQNKLNLSCVFNPSPLIYEVWVAVSLSERRFSDDLK